MNFLILFALAFVSFADYQQDELWAGTNFYNHFDFMNIPDPTHGYVTFLSGADAFAKGLVRDSDPVHMGSDHTNIAQGAGRESIRLESKTAWTVSPGSPTYLFVIDLVHMPVGCGTWPAWWFFGPNWPHSGEIDIIEGVHEQSFTQTTLHTGPGCTTVNTQQFQTGSWLHTNCVSSGGDNQGCGVRGPDGSYGYPLNANGGGVFVAVWDHQGISAFFFPRGQIPADLSRGSTNANPNSWGKPYAYFPLDGNCDASHFRNNKMTFDLTFCGDWAGATFGQACPGRGSCVDFVRNNPGAFSEAYWTINFVKVMSQANGQNSAPAPFGGVVPPPPVATPPSSGNNNGGNNNGGGGNGCTCSAKPGATGLQGALDWVCGQINCQPINPGGANFEPNTLQAHASWAFNSYYQQNGQQAHACDFTGNAQTSCSGGGSPSGNNGGGNGCTCSAKPGATGLQGALDWVCGQINCQPINPGGANFEPNTLQAHASWAFNSYYQQNGQQAQACDFTGNAQTSCGGGGGSPSGGNNNGGGCSCAVKNGANAQAVQQGLDWVCGQVNCQPINPGGANFEPNTLQAHASWAFNAYYQQHGRAAGTCDFSGTAATTCGGSPPSGGNSGGGDSCPCAVKNGANAQAVQQGLDWVCGQINCQPINPGGAHFEPNTLNAHASWAFNAYYQQHGRAAGTCDFSGTAAPTCGGSPPSGGNSGGSNNGGGSCPCAVKNGANAQAVQQGLDWVCGQINCQPINPGGANFEPNTLQAHASWAFNAYYQQHGRAAGTCDFSGTAAPTCGGSPSGGNSGGGCRCVAKNGADAGGLQGALDWVCGQINCQPINPGGANFEPNTLQAHASWAFNSYHNAHKDSGSCDFAGLATLSCSNNREQDASTPSGGLSRGAVAGIIIGVVAGVVVVAAIIGYVAYSHFSKPSDGSAERI